ncbi:sugar-phosphatase [Oceanobacillus alkalisoli]|uniref:sugar-phosphatase n=1 Tax=Oceanobacillus alkalisoli TaxID=2925113 RepID=UPI001EF0C664|nr:sugar-phosphatase [Oceanobacillus alkalisoli]MCF3943200.1 sugar-phosphatase [Oceanobacillus alkalisoli]MCG5103922.1 sugar-phosphatase [Oceanobacillus alkalisoli]
MYKLIAIDMDGTLLNDHHQVSKETKDTLMKAKEHGAKIVLCSGRPIVGMRQYIADLNLNEADDYAIAYNGAYIENTNTGEVVSEFSLEYKHLVELHDLSVELNVPMHYFDHEELYTPNKAISKYTVLESFLNDISLNYCPVDEFPKEQSIPNIMFIDEPVKLSEALKQLPKELADTYAMVKSAPHFAEFTHLKATKGNAVKRLAERLGIKQEEIMAIGDNGNDRSMIEYAGCGVAMENAIPELKEVADYQTLTNNEDGVAHAIEKLLLAKA